MSAKPIVFISHIDDEKEIAAAFKSLIENAFLGLISVFVSSDARSIELGERWLNAITEALKTCAIEFIICSPISVTRPWINFEAGAGWVRDIPVVPLCHSGMQPAGLPLPLNLLQAANLNEVSSLRHVFVLLSSVLKSNVPSVEFTEFITTVKEFETRYTFWHGVNYEFSFLKQFLRDDFDALINGKVELAITETGINLVHQSCGNLMRRGIITMSQTGVSSHGPDGTFYGQTISLTEFGNTIVKDARFRR
jgi:TIR domain